MKAAALCLSAALAAAAVPAFAQTSPCSSQQVEVLARQDVSLREWKGHLDQLGDDVDQLRVLGDALVGVKRSYEIVTSLLSVASKVAMVVDHLRARYAFATADRIARDFPADAEQWRARGTRHRSAFTSAVMQELLGLIDLSQQAIVDKVVAGSVDAVRSDLERETRRLRDGLREDYQALSTARRAWREAHERCLPDLQVVPSPLAGRNRAPVHPAAQAPAQTPARAAAAAAAPGRYPTEGDGLQAASLGAAPAAAVGSAPRPAQRPAAPRRRLDLDALDRMAADNREEAHSEPPPAGRPLSQDAYLSACAGKETSAACHRVHCLHVGAALGDEKWTARCLRGD